MTLSLLRTFVIALALNLGLAHAASCTPKPLKNGGFETGHLAPWDASLEGKPTVTITDTAYKSKFAANLSLIYDPSDATGEGSAPLINLLQRINYCGLPQNLTYYYNVQPKQVYHTRFNVFIYDVMTKVVYYNKFVYYNGSSTVDSEGNKYGTWNQLETIFKPKSNDLIFSVVVGGSYNKTHGTSTVLVDGFKIATPVF